VDHAWWQTTWCVLLLLLLHVCSCLCMSSVTDEEKQQGFDFFIYLVPRNISVKPI
jgi:predicted adenine nucleotide alpha hydrolase (AANH) superfamily ATPase